MNNVQVYLQILIDIIMKIVAYFKRTDNSASNSTK